VQLRALLGLLVHTSPRSILLPGGRRIIGSASTLIIGPSGVGKTTVLAGLTERIDFGEIVAGEAMSRAGLLYAISGGHVRPGALPRNHGGLVLADELHKDTDNCLAEATSGRSSGLLRISMSVRAELPMNTRLIAIGNLRLRGQRGAGGGLSLALNDLEFPILGAGFLEAEDLRRFDIVAVAGPIDPLVGLVGPSEPSTFTWDGLRSLIATAWDLDVDDPATFDWPDGTVEELRAQVGRLNRWYICEQVPLFGAVTFEKLARLSCAAARLLPVQLDRLVHVTAAHVRFVAWLLHQVYRPAVNGLRRLARLERQIVTAPNEQILEGLMLAVRRIDQGEQLARILASRQYVPVRDMAALTGFSAPTIYTRLREFKQLDLARSHGRNGFAATTLLIQLVVRMGQLPVPG
jgi:hypothetical protein